LCSGKVNVYSNDIDGDSMLALKFMATNNVKVSAVGLADVINFTISKSGNGSFFERNTIEGDYKLEDGLESKTFLTYKGTKASFTPKNEMTDYNRILYTIGNTGISYSIEVNDNNPFYIKNLNDVEQKIIEQKIDDSFIIENVDDSIEYIGLDEGAPYYSNINDVLEIDYTGGEVYNDLYITGLSAIVVYESK